MLRNVRSKLGFLRPNPTPGLARRLRVLRWQVVAPLVAALAAGFGRLVCGWPLGLPSPPVRARGDGVRIAYFHHAFPSLSETFIQREILALRSAGLPLAVFSLERPELEGLDASARALIAETRYLTLEPLGRRSPALCRYLCRKPLVCTKLFFYTVWRQHTPRKSWATDWGLMARALVLAVAAEEWGATHLHSPWASPDAYVVLLASRLLGLPYSVHARASDIHRHSSRPGLFERLNHAAFIVTNSEYNREILEKLLNGSSRPLPIVRIYNGLDPAEFTPVSTPVPPDNRPLILAVGRLIEAKGFEHLLRACALLKQQGREFRCEIIGTAPADAPNYRIRLLKLRRNLDLEADVAFVGALPADQVRARYGAASLFVLPAVIAADGTGDVTPNVLLEAMATARPVISTRSRAIPELVEDGESGLLVTPGDADALAEAMACVLDAPDLAARLGANGRARVLAKFDIHRNIRPMLALFRGELDDPGIRRG